ncbi:hypothetical protein [Streptacidiphilus sp. MAP5-3]|uniref:hypothetical protein n=1 Tax=unclassified Streptacidiphilus TaxID=2643834 RepID=UPI003518FCEC
MYRVTYTVEAQATRDALSHERQQLLDQGLAVLAKDPYHEATTHVGINEADRKAQVAPGIMIEYLIAHALMVVAVIEVFDDSLIAHV